MLAHRRKNALVGLGFWALTVACGQTEIERWAMGMPRVGAPAPGFSLPAADGSELELADLRGRRVVLYFYPSDGSPNCSLEAASFRDHLRTIDSLGATVVGISVDSIASHAAFCQQLAIPFPLLSDSGGSVCRAYGTLAPDGRAHRSTFVIDENGNVRAVFPAVRVPGHVQEVLRVLRAMEPLGSRQRAP